MKKVEGDVDGKGMSKTICSKFYDCSRSMMWLSESVTDLYLQSDQNMTSAAQEQRHHISLRIVYEITNCHAMQCISIFDNSLLS